MIPRHLPLPFPPARCGGSARSYASSALFVFAPALCPQNPSFLFIRLRTLSFPVTPLFATLTKTTGVGTNNSQNGTSRLLPERNSHESANCYRRQRLQLRPAPLSVPHRQRPPLPHG